MVAADMSTPVHCPRLLKAAFQCPVWAAWLKMQLRKQQALMGLDLNLAETSLCIHPKGKSMGYLDANSPKVSPNERQLNWAQTRDSCRNPLRFVWCKCMSSGNLDPILHPCLISGWMVSRLETWNCFLPPVVCGWASALHSPCSAFGVECNDGH